MEKENGKADSIAETNTNELIVIEDPEADLREMEGDEVLVIEGNMSERQGGETPEPCVGMEFESEEAARKFYFEYARREGFVVRIMQRRRSEIDGRTLARRLGCNRQGFSPNQQVKIGLNKKPRTSAREGCQATILLKMEKSGKWVVTRYVKDHNHPLVVTNTTTTTTTHGFNPTVDKDKKIEELTRELQRQDELCELYRRRLLNFLASIEEQSDMLSSKVQDVVQNVKKFEAEVQTLSSSHRWRKR